MADIVGPVYAIKDHAGFIRRTCALAIDLLIILAVWMAIDLTWLPIHSKDERGAAPWPRGWGWFFSCFPDKKSWPQENSKCAKKNRLLLLFCGFCVFLRLLLFGCGRRP